MMFQREKNRLMQEAESRLPELLAYLKKNYQPEKPRASEERRYSLPEDASGQGKVQHNFRMDEEDTRFPVSQPGEKEEKPLEFPAGPDADALMKRVRKNPELMDSPAVRRYYHSWEKRNALLKSFSSEVARLVEEKFRKPSAFYLPAGIDKRTFHRMKTDYAYKPSKNTAIRCCLGLHLDREEAEDLLKLAGYALSPSDPSDLVVRFCLENGIWDLAGVNLLMNSFDIRDLEGYSPEEMSPPARPF